MIPVNKSKGDFISMDKIAFFYFAFTVSSNRCTDPK